MKSHGFRGDEAVLAAATEDLARQGVGESELAAFVACSAQHHAWNSCRTLQCV